MTREEGLIRKRVMLRAIQKDKSFTPDQLQVINEELEETNRELEILHGTPKAIGQQKQSFMESLGLTKQDEQQSEPIFLIPSKIKNTKRDLRKVIRSGIDGIDKKIIGFNPEELSIWSGSNGSGKSTVLSQIALESVNQGFKVAIFSGELNADRIMDWLSLQAAGKKHTEATKYENFYTVPDDIKLKISQWLDNKLFIYNNNYGNNVNKVLRAVIECIKQNGINTVIIDNMMSLQTTSISTDKYEGQTALVIALTEIAKQYKVHIHFVSHPRKQIGLLRKMDISGSSDITNAADNCLIVHRVGMDFKKATKQDLGFKDDHPLYSYSNVIEICKNRSLGVVDVFVGTHFETESKRFLNSKDEKKYYGWEANQNGFYPADDEKLPFDE
jgi:KaiC/GvpD/RAD55 family RecA-like ATPase